MIPGRTTLQLLRSGVIAVNGGRGKGRQANCDILGPFGFRRPVLHPFMAGNHDRFSGPDVNKSSRVFTCSMPFKTTVYSSKSGFCPGSIQPEGLFITATLTRESLRIHQAEVFLDDLFLVPGSFDNRRFFNFYLSSALHSKKDSRWQGA